MKALILVLVAGMLLPAKKSTAQNILQSKKLSRHVIDAPFKEFISDLADSAGYHFAITNGLFRKCKPLTIDFDSLDFPAAMARSFEAQPAQFRIEGTMIIIFPRDVTGVVTGADGEPLAGAAIIGSGKRKTALTDEQGMFTLSKSAQDSFIDVYAVNHKQLRVLINRNTRLEIRLQKKVASADTIYIIQLSTGFSQLTPERASGAYEGINKEQLSKRPSPNLLTRMAHLNSGLVVNTTGTAGSQSPAITIRGISTLQANKRPLVIVDRFPYEGDINNLNPNDIEAITILKDAAATSIWGARAGNGVIVITTRQGLYQHRSKLSFRSYTTWQLKPNAHNLQRLGPASFLELEQQLFDRHFYDHALRTSYQIVSPAVEIMSRWRNGKLDSSQAVRALAQLGQHDVRDDYNNYFYRPGMTQQYALSLQGGDSLNKFYLSASVDKQDIVLTGGTRERFTLTATHTTRLFKRLEVTTAASLTRNKAHNDDIFPTNPYIYDRLADNEGKPLAVTDEVRQSYKDSQPPGLFPDWNYRPLQELALRNNTWQLFHVRLMAECRYTVSPDLKLNLTYQYLYETARESDQYASQSYIPRNLYNRLAHINGAITTSPVPKGALEDWQQRKYASENLRLLLNYDHVFRNEWRITALTGVESSSAQKDTMGGRRYPSTVNFNTDYPVYYDASITQQLPGKPYDITINDQYRSAFGNAGVTWKKKYTATFSGRVDQTNLVGSNTNHQIVPLWSTGLKWEIVQDPAPTLPWLNNLSLRTTYGHSGNVVKSVSANLTTTNTVRNRYGADASVMVNAANPDLRWENVSLFNVGLDFRLFGALLVGSIDYYRRTGKDLVIDQVTNTTSGAIMNRSNAGELTGRGFEVELKNHLTMGKWELDCRLQLAYSAHKITAYDTTKLTAWDRLATGRPRKGWPSDAIFGLRSYSLDPATGDPQGFYAGIVSKNYKAILGNTEDSLEYRGTATPLYNANLSYSIRFDKLSLSFLLIGQFGYVVRIPGISYSTGNGMDPGLIDFPRRWQRAGDEKLTNVPSIPNTPDPYRDLFYNNSSQRIEKAANIRLYDVTLNYDLGKKLCNRLHLSAASIYLYSTNGGILWKASSSVADPDSPTQIPQPRSFSAGIKLDL